MYSVIIDGYNGDKDYDDDDDDDDDDYDDDDDGGSVGNTNLERSSPGFHLGDDDSVQ